MSREEDLAICALCGPQAPSRLAAGLLCPCEGMVSPSLQVPLRLQRESVRGRAHPSLGCSRESREKGWGAGLGDS